MKKTTIFILLTISMMSFSFGKITVIATYGYIADILQQVGGKNISVTFLAKGTRDPHFITPKPSFIAKLRKADLLVINGGQLEIGWLPPVLKQANNPDIQPGNNGFLSLMDFVSPLEIPGEVSRSHGDVHPEGNPHIQLDPYNIPKFAKAITDKLNQLDPENSNVYNQNYTNFLDKWQKKTTQWDIGMNKIKGMKVVEYHKLYEYLFHRYHIVSAGTLEPLPGIPPSSKHIAAIINTIKIEKIGIIAQDVYHSSKTAIFVSSQTNSKLVILPHDIGAVPEVKDIFSLFDEIVRRLTET